MQDSVSSNPSEPIRLSESATQTFALCLTLVAILAAGIAVAISNLTLPIARNAFCYAKAALAILNHHFNLIAVMRDATLTSGKPIIFSSLAAPAVWMFGANTGTVIAAVVGTIFFLWMTILALQRLNSRAHLAQKLLPLELLLVFLNPLVIYQFWSGYPDSLFAGLVLAAFVISDSIASEAKSASTVKALLLGLTIFVAIHTKLYGSILLAACPAYILAVRRKLSPLLMIVISVLIVDLLTAQLGINPLLQLSEGAGYGGFGNSDILGSVVMFGFFAVMMLHFSLAFLWSKSAWRAWTPAPALFIGIYLLVLLAFSGTFYNMRYFIPALPFIAVSLTAGSASFSRRAKGPLLTAYCIVSIVLISIFNIQPVERMADPGLSRLTANMQWALWLDNLRLQMQLRLKRQIDAINSHVPRGSRFYWSSDYYSTATHGMGKEVGVSSSVDIRYVLHTRDIPPSATSVYTTEFGVDGANDQLHDVPGWATATPLGDGLFRLDPRSSKQN